MVYSMILYLQCYTEAILISGSFISGWNYMFYQTFTINPNWSAFNGIFSLTNQEKDQRITHPLTLGTATDALQQNKLSEIPQNGDINLIIVTSGQVTRCHGLEIHPIAFLTLFHHFQRTCSTISICLMCVFWWPISRVRYMPFGQLSCNF